MKQVLVLLALTIVISVAIYFMSAFMCAITELAGVIIQRNM